MGARTKPVYSKQIAKQDREFRIKDIQNRVQSSKHPTSKAHNEKNATLHDYALNGLYYEGTHRIKNKSSKTLKRILHRKIETDRNKEKTTKILQRKLPRELAEKIVNKIKPYEFENISADERSKRQKYFEIFPDYPILNGTGQTVPGRNYNGNLDIGQPFNYHENEIRRILKKKKLPNEMISVVENYNRQPYKMRPAEDYRKDEIRKILKTRKLPNELILKIEKI